MLDISYTFSPETCTLHKNQWCSCLYGNFQRTKGEYTDIGESHPQRVIYGWGKWRQADNNARTHTHTHTHYYRSCNFSFHWTPIIHITIIQEQGNNAVVLVVVWKRRKKKVWIWIKIQHPVNYCLLLISCTLSNTPGWRFHYYEWQMTRARVPSRGHVILWCTLREGQAFGLFTPLNK